MRVKSVQSVSSWSVAIILSVGMSTGCSEDAGSSGGDSSTTTTTTTSIEVPSPRPAPASTPEPEPEPSSTPPVELSSEELIAGGRSVYSSNCIACHSLDPTKDGALGPAVSGASLALLEARILRSEYPEGYAPKRMTKVMIALPHLEPRLAELAAYLNSLE